MTNLHVFLYPESILYGMYTDKQEILKIKYFLWNLSRQLNRISISKLCFMIRKDALGIFFPLPIFHIQAL